MAVLNTRGTEILARQVIQTVASRHNQNSLSDARGESRQPGCAASWQEPLDNIVLKALRKEPERRYRLGGGVIRRPRTLPARSAGPGTQRGTVGTEAANF